MTTHATGTRADWLKARIDLLAAEKELTRQGDALAERRQALPKARSRLQRMCLPNPPGLAKT